MRYDNKRDWVEIAGVADKPMRVLAQLDGDSILDAHKLALDVTKDAHFLDASGNVVDWRSDVLGLTVQQWNWWKSRIWATARDERISPEA